MEEAAKARILKALKTTIDNIENDVITDIAILTTTEHTINVITEILHPANIHLAAHKLSNDCIRMVFGKDKS